MIISDSCHGDIMDISEDITANTFRWPMETLETIYLSIWVNVGYEDLGLYTIPNHIVLDYRVDIDGSIISDSWQYLGE